MSKKVAINGFGRIGRLTFRNLLKNPDIEVVAINDLTDNATLAHLFKYDSAHGIFEGTVESTDDHLIINGKKISASAERNPANLPWKELGVDVVLECTGIFLAADKAKMHLDAGAKKVLLSAPGKGGDIKTIVLGVNDDELTADQNIISNASCTTNCFAPVIKLLNDNWGVKVGSMTTTHAYTGDQNIQDAPHKDLRRARAAAYNIVPTSTGAAKAIGAVVPEVAGKLSAIALRVPVVDGSLIEVNVLVEKSTTPEEINSVFKAASEGRMKGVLEYCTVEIVSSDIIRNPHSSIFDSLMTQVQDGNFIKVVSWYDNEAGYSARLAELTDKVCKLV
ncbi:MAG: type I glyceraldehyde-3-phosphate dehydrogenase [Saprospiraceae bacterium]|nr:type I glyceraldehyde-3-phosphate dehydrogenase [Saprospiraceae bacterium]